VIATGAQDATLYLRERGRGLGWLSSRGAWTPANLIRCRPPFLWEGGSGFLSRRRANPRVLRLLGVPGEEPLESGALPGVSLRGAREARTGWRGKGARRRVRLKARLLELESL
jgi:hypothetical protein